MDSGNRLKICGIYCLIHRDTGKCYIGQSVDIKRRMIDHKSNAVNGSVTRIASAIREFGMDSFDIEIVEECSQNELDEREVFWMRFYKSASRNGFNIYQDPRGGLLGFSMSAASRDRMSAAKKGRKQHPNTRAALQAMYSRNRGKPLSESHRSNIGKGNTGKVRSAEAKEKIRQFRLKYKIPDSTRAAMSAAAKKRCLTQNYNVDNKSCIEQASENRV